MAHTSDISNNVLKVLRKIIRAVDVQSKQLVKEYGLTGPQILILKELHAAEDITVGKIAANVDLSQSTVTNILERLENRGFISRSRSNVDKRRVNIKLEEKGVRILEMDPSLLQEHFVRRFKELPDWEQSAILSSLQRVAAMMDAADIEEPVSSW
jgi:DNA-binding MarR family transcriptional regulator